MKITFDPNDKQDVESVLRIIGKSEITVQVNTLDSSDLIPATTVAEIAASSDPRPMEPVAPVPTTVAPDNITHETPPVCEKYGQPFNAEYHQSPPKMKADRSWTAKRGKGDEAEAALAAFLAQKTETAGNTMVNGTPTEAAPTPVEAPVAPAPVAPTPPTAMPTAPTPMPAAMPATPEPNTPVAPIAFEQMVSRFVAMCNDQKIADFNAVYAALGYDHAEAETNETMRRRMWVYMDQIDNGATHDVAVANANA